MAYRLGWRYSRSVKSPLPSLRHTPLLAPSFGCRFCTPYKTRIPKGSGGCPSYVQAISPVVFHGPISQVETRPKGESWVCRAELCIRAYAGWIPLVESLSASGHVKPGNKRRNQPAEVRARCEQTRRFCSVGVGKV